MSAHEHASAVRSGAETVQRRFSAENRRWVERVYAADAALYARECGAIFVQSARALGLLVVVLFSL